MFQLPWVHNPQLSWEGLLKGAGEESAAASRTSDPRGPMWFSSWPWNTEPALYPRGCAGGGMGVCPTSPHVFCVSGEGLEPCSSMCPVGDALGVWGRWPFVMGHSISEFLEPELDSCQ